MLSGDLPHDGPAVWQAGRHDRGRGDDLAGTERPVQVIRVILGCAEYLPEALAAGGGVLLRQRVEQIEGIVAVERAGSPGSHPATIS